MSGTMFKVTFQPQGRTVFVLSGTTLLEAAARAGLVIDTPCGGAGTCGKCRVRITAGAGTPTPTDRCTFSDQELADGWRLACRNQVTATYEQWHANQFYDQFRCSTWPDSPELDRELKYKFNGIC